MLPVVMETLRSIPLRSGLLQEEVLDRLHCWIRGLTQMHVTQWGHSFPPLQVADGVIITVSSPVKNCGQPLML